MDHAPRGKGELSYRTRKILYAVVTEYVASGEPVGSRTLARRYGLSLSSATIRNVLADLEEAGYLAQPHTSAGRVPTDLGFRVFVDALIQTREVAVEDKSALMQRMQSLRPGLDDPVREAGRLLSSLTGTAAVVTQPRAADEVLAHVRFVPLRGREVLAVLVSRGGNVQNRVVQVPRDLDAAELDRVHNYLVEFVSGRTLPEVRQALAAAVADEQGRYEALRLKAQAMVDATLLSAPAESTVHIEGQGVLFDRPEFADGEMIRGFLRAFEEKERLLELLDRTLAAGGVQVLIGAEAHLADLEDVSVVSASYSRSGATVGTVGIIGPARIDYAKAVPLVGYTARMMSDVLDRGLPNGAARPPSAAPAPATPAPPGAEDSAAPAPKKPTDEG